VTHDHHPPEQNRLGRGTPTDGKGHPRLKIFSLSRNGGFDIAEAGEVDVSPSPAPHPLGLHVEEKLSGMYPV